jgi:hypothetical protein
VPSKGSSRERATIIPAVTIKVTYSNETPHELVKHAPEVANCELLSHPSLLPSLEHQDSPKLSRPVLFSTQVFHPLLANRCWIEYAVFLQFSGVEKFFGPRAKGPAKPLTQRYVKSHLGALEKARRKVAGQNQTKNPLALSLIDFEVEG